MLAGYPRKAPIFSDSLTGDQGQRPLSRGRLLRVFSGNRIGGHGDSAPAQPGSAGGDGRRGGRCLPGDAGGGGAVRDAPGLRADPGPAGARARPGSQPEHDRGEEFAAWFSARWGERSPSTWNVALDAVARRVTYGLTCGRVLAQPGGLRGGFCGRVLAPPWLAVRATAVTVAAGDRPPLDHRRLGVLIADDDVCRVLGVGLAAVERLAWQVAGQVGPELPRLSRSARYVTPPRTSSASPPNSTSGHASSSATRPPRKP